MHVLLQLLLGSITLLILLVGPGLVFPTNFPCLSAEPRQKLVAQCFGNTKHSMLVMFGNISLAYLSLKRCHARGGSKLVSSKPRLASRKAGSTSCNRHLYSVFCEILLLYR